MQRIKLATWNAPSCTGVFDPVLATLLLICLPANTPGRHQMMMQMTVLHPPMWKTQITVPGVCPWPSPACCGHSRSESIGGRSLFPSVSPIITLSFK